MANAFHVIHVIHVIAMELLYLIAELASGLFSTFTSP